MIILLLTANHYNMIILLLTPNHYTMIILLLRLGIGAVFDAFVKPETLNRYMDLDREVLS
jgi:hypothetical protein